MHTRPSETLRRKFLILVDLPEEHRDYSVVLLFLPNHKINQNPENLYPNPVAHPRLS